MNAPRIQAQALLPGERLELRGLARAAGSGADPILLRDAPGLAAFAFRWGAVVLFGATGAGRDTLLPADPGPALAGEIAVALFIGIEMVTKLYGLLR
ncbi:MAG: hypothetical protein JWR00_4740 [Rubritepida sp.]|nr:hypothetical protein [Rubritepida sp.]